MSDEGFADPVIRCDSCHEIVTRASVQKVGACEHCGNRRMRNVTVFNEVERQKMLDWGFSEFVNDFEAVQ